MSNQQHDTIKRREAISGSTYQPTNVHMPGHVSMQLPDTYYRMAEKYLRERLLHNPELFTHA